jgi:hypothetical protein
MSTLQSLRGNYSGIITTAELLRDFNEIIDR